MNDVPLFCFAGYPTRMFVTNPIDTFLCPICKEVLKCPKMCLKGHTFCAGCISLVMDHNPQCPCCKMHLREDNIATNILIQECISSLHVFCDFKVSTQFGELPCQWKGPLSDIEIHQRNCTYNKVNLGIQGANVRLDVRENVHGSYFGEWKDNKKDGSGVFKTLDYEYCGGFKDDLRSGSGRITFRSDKTTFTGVFSDGILAQGFATFPDGFYNGELLEFEQNGKGTMEFKSSANYHGYWLKGKFHGLGIHTKETGEKYDGEFEDGLRCGKGLCTKQDGSSYRGDYLVDQKHGEGDELFPGGSRYIGTFRGNIPFGEGTWYNSEGDITHTRCKRNIECVYLDF